MLKKSRRHSTAREAYFHTIEDTYERCENGHLWFRVLYQAVVDADDLESNNITKRNQAKSAIVWLLRDHADFHTVCSLANVGADSFRMRVKRWLNTRYSVELLDGVFASPRQRGAKPQ